MDQVLVPNFGLSHPRPSTEAPIPGSSPALSPLLLLRSGLPTDQTVDHRLERSGQKYFIGLGKPKRPSSATQCLTVYAAQQVN